MPSQPTGSSGEINMTKKPSDTTDPNRREVLTAAAAVTAQLMVPPTLIKAQESAPTTTRTRLDLDRFVQDCIDANREDESQAAVLEVLANAVSDPGRMLATVGEPSRAGISIIHRSETLTIFNAVWTPQMNLMRHNHMMVGEYRNLYWARRQHILGRFRGSNRSVWCESTVRR